MNKKDIELLIEFIALKNKAIEKENYENRLVLIFEELDSQLDVTQ